MILSITLNPSVDHALFLDRLEVGDTNRVKRVERDAGGKGVNLSRVVAELGGETVATGFLGGGPGEYVRHVLAAQRVRHEFVTAKEETRINFSVETADGGPPTTFNEMGPTISPEDWSVLSTRVRELAAKSSWAALGGSLPPGAPADAFRQLAEIARSAGAKILLDADGEPLRSGLEGRPDFIKPNSREAGRLLGRTIESDAEATAAARELLGRVAPGGLVVISRGERGAVLASGETLLIGSSPKVEVRSTVGSGDSLLAGMLWAMEAGKPLDEAFRWGLAAGAATAETDGSSIARVGEIRRLFPLAAVRSA